MRYTDMMLDIETLGTAPGSAIIQVGAVLFSPEMPAEEWDTFDTGPITLASCQAVGLTTDADTLNWWREQAPEARVTFDRALSCDGCHIVNALQALASVYPPGASVWSNGANFDGVLVREAMRRASVACPWNYYDERCHRTMKKEWSEVPSEVFKGVKHSALDDARHQAEHLAAIWEHVENLRNAIRAVQEVVVDEPSKA